MSYVVEITPRARRDLKKLTQDVRLLLQTLIERLSDEPRPPGVTKMEGFDNLYRVREGDYRIVYEIHDRVLLIVVVRVGHRQDVYKYL